MSSQAMACTRARSRGGKIGLTPAPWLVFQRKIGKRPAPTPASNPVDRHVNRSGRFRVRYLRLLVQQADQGRSLPQLKRNLPLPLQCLGFCQELRRERGTMRRFGAAHGWLPVALRSWVSIRRPSAYQKSRFGNLVINCEMDHLVKRDQEKAGLE